MKNRQILLARRPRGVVQESDFALTETDVAALKDGQFLVRNDWLSMDAGFRQWMNEGSGDNYMQPMALGAPVRSITLGEVVDSKNPDHPVGEILMGRLAWEDFSIADGTDYLSPVQMDPDVHPAAYLGILGTSGLTAWYGLTKVGQVVDGDDILISTAAGSVGVAAGQLAKLLGCGKLVGLTSDDGKADWLKRDQGYDSVINYRTTSDLPAAIRVELPHGMDVFFDNVGGATLEAAIGNLKEGARIILCGAMAQYSLDELPPGPRNLFELVTKRAHMAGFMFSDYVDENAAALEQLACWLKAGKLDLAHTIIDGLPRAGEAFCSLFTGTSRGKMVVKVR